MATVGSTLLPVLLTLLSLSTKNIEKAFLQNDAQLLFEQFASSQRITVILPEPLSFSDQLSGDQAYFIFSNIFSLYSTLEFYPETPHPSSLPRPWTIFKARWSFIDKKDKTQHVLQVYFTLWNETPDSVRDRRADRKGQTASPASPWRITEIKAKKI